MRKLFRGRYAALALVLVLVLAAGTLRVANAALTLSIDRWVLSNGSATSTGGSYTLSDTVGQPVAGVAVANGSYQLTAGFESAASAAGLNLKTYLPALWR